MDWLMYKHQKLIAEQFWRLQGQGPGSGYFGVWWGPIFWLPEWCFLTVASLSARASLIPEDSKFQSRTPSSPTNHSLNALPPTVTLGSQCMTFEGKEHLVPLQSLLDSALTYFLVRVFQSLMWWYKPLMSSLGRLMSVGLHSETVSRNPRQEKA